MNENFEERLRFVTKLIGESASKERVLAEAKKLKQDMTTEVTLLWLKVTTLDYLVVTFAPDADWRTGWWTEPAIGTPPAPSVGGHPPRLGRPERTLEIARVLGEGMRTVKTEAIAEKLRMEGDTSSTKDLRTAIGNVLTSSGRWHRVGPGEYAPIMEELP